MPYALTHPAIDFDAWISSSAAGFRSNLAATFPGKVFRFTNAQTLKHVAQMTPLLKKIDDLIWPIWYPSGDESAWYTIDQWAINENRNHYYNDHVHFNGPLTHATLHQVLNMLCPDLGTSASYLADLEKHVLEVSRTASSFTEDVKRQKLDDGSSSGDEVEYFLFDRKSGQLHVVDKACLPLLKLRSTFPVGETEIKAMPRGQAFPAFLCSASSTPPKLIRPVSSKVVYLVENNQRRMFPSADVFMSRGFEWGQISVVEDWVADMIPEGGPLTRRLAAVLRSGV